MRILLTERDPFAIKRKLAAFGHTVEVAQGYPKVDALARSGGFDAIVLDLDALENGLSLLTQWRHRGMEEHVLALTSSRADMVRALDVGADAAVALPCPVAELLARFRAMLRLGRQASEPVLRRFDLEIRPDARSVKRGGKDIRLTCMEFRLLQLLVTHQGKALGKSTILSFLNNAVTEVRSNIVAVYVRYLRRKIDKGFDLPLICTIYGKGYMFRPETPAEEEHSTRTLDSAICTSPRKSHPTQRQHRSGSLEFHRSAT